ncbi:Hemerythrin HHE cation binding domain-containing protein [Nannocystis exedens]|uniref:Hemerythrin HHE cation binding domain-containing protein n=1 Tax=Nannocystis exedens TaxID=54 RepID=A0A1I2AYB9_9BACT|nr:hemerythrin domain-containing protein [Nannocystis exedens]PCC74344.1 DNA nickase [Nannocystis exedens]SFE48759.1 Hemerythrin HHE cation binding domain-containing protein [Nannocystis exedens]
MSEPTIWDLLERDHEALGALLADIQAAPEAAARGLLPRFVCELTAHARAKGSVLYGHLLHDERARAQVVEGLEELERIRAAHADLELLPAGDEKWSVRLAALADAVRTHFRVEKTELLALARQALSEVQATELGARYLAERARIKGDLSCFADSR